MSTTKYLLGESAIGLGKMRKCKYVALLFLLLHGRCLLAAAIKSDAPTSQPIILNIIGGLADVNQYTRHEEPFWTNTISERTKGQVRATIQPFDKAGILGNEVVRLMRVGVVPFGTALAGVSSATKPIWAAPDLPGMHADITSVRRAVNAVRADLAQSMLEEDGIVLLAIYSYPAQLILCRDPLTRLRDIAGRKVRVATVAIADYIQALGGFPVTIPFADIPLSLRNLAVDCVVTGGMSAYTLKLHEQMSFVLALPITWGLSIFAANKDAWQALPQSLRNTLKNDLLPKLENDIWDEADRSTTEGLRCLSGDGQCSNGKPGHMKIIAASPGDIALSRDTFKSGVLPAWIRRCGEQCVNLWDQKLKLLRGQ